MWLKSTLSSQTKCSCKMNCSSCCHRIADSIALFAMTLAVLLKPCVRTGGRAGTGSHLPPPSCCCCWLKVCCGHSLGAGVAAVLSMHLRTRYPGLRCWAFAPPGGLMSVGGSLAMREYCTSVIIGKDMIPRLSLRSVERLADEMLVAASRCKVGLGSGLGPVVSRRFEIRSQLLIAPPADSARQLSKTRIWLGTTVLGTKFKEEDVFKPEEEVHEVRFKCH